MLVKENPEESVQTSSGVVNFEISGEMGKIDQNEPQVLFLLRKANWVGKDGGETMTETILTSEQKGMNLHNTYMIKV